MPNIAILQAISGGVDASDNTTNRTATYTSNVSAGSLLLVCASVSNNAAYNLAISDNKSNTWTLIDAAYTDPKGAGIWYAWANAGSVGTMPVVTVGKSGSACGVGVSIYEFSNVNASVFDGTPVALANIGAGPAQVTLPTTTYTNDLVFAVIGTDGTGWTTTTPLSGYTTSISISGAVQHHTITKATTATGAYTPGWTLTNSSKYAVVGLVLKGTTVTATINGTSSTTPAHGASLTITGMNFGASAGTVSLGGVAQTPTSWSDTSIVVTCNKGTNKYGVPLNLVVTTSGAVTSNTYTGITALLPPSGKGYVDLGTPNATAANRLTAIADLASGDQIEYDNVGVTVFSDATFAAAANVTSFTAAAWSSGNGWGAAATQSTLNTATLIAITGHTGCNVGGTGTITVSTNSPLQGAQTESIALSDGASGTFSPSTVNLSSTTTSVAVTYTPSGGAGNRTITAVATGTPTLPNLTYGFSVTAIASALSITGPASGVASTATSLTISTNNVLVQAQTESVALSDGASGTFSPSTVSLSASTPSVTVTYTPTATLGTRTITATPTGTPTLSANTYSYLVRAADATAVTLTGPIGGKAGEASTAFTAAMSGYAASNVIVTPSDGGGGGAFSPTSVTLSTAVQSATFTYTPVNAQANRTISVTNNGGLANPASLNYAALVIAGGAPAVTVLHRSLFFR